MSPKAWLRRRKWMSDERRFRSRFLDFVETGSAEPGDHDLLLSAFLASQGSSLTWANQILTQASSSSDFAQAPDTLGCGGDSALVEAAVSALRDWGWFLMPLSLPTDTQDALVSHLSSQKCRLVSDDIHVNGKSDFIDWTTPQAEVYQIEEARVVANAHVQRLLIDRTLLSIAQEYLGVPPIVTNAMAWFTFPRSGPSNEAAQTFHFDLERIKWLKVFFFLTDVTENSGPHIYIPRTQHDSAIPRALLDMGYDRMPDEAVTKYFAPDQWRSMTGPRGCVLLEDTRGLHKGTNVLEDHRLVLQFQYSSSLFGSNCAFMKGYPPECQEWEMVSRRYPKVLCSHVS